MIRTIQPTPRLMIQAALYLLLVLNSAPVNAASLLEALKAGGYVIYFRHAQTEWSQSDRVSAAEDWRSCDPQNMRQLSAEGRRTAQGVGARIKQLGIPVAEVFASEYCRTLETARLLDLAPAQTTRDILNANVADYIGGTEALRQTAIQRLSHPPAAGSNTVLVAHGNVFLLSAGTRPVECGAAIIRPHGNGEFEVIANLAPEDWLAEDGILTQPINQD